MAHATRAAVVVRLEENDCHSAKYLPIYRYALSLR